MNVASLRRAAGVLSLAVLALACATGPAEESGDSYNPCDSDSCPDNSTCRYEDNTMYCDCDDGYFGGGNACYPETTASGTCTMDADGDISCDCAPGYQHEHYTSTACTDLNECDLPDQGGCEAWCTNTEGGLECGSTVADESSPYWGYSCDPNMSQTEVQTHLHTDCRCGINKSAFSPLGQCKRPSTAGSEGYSFGEGPRMYDLAMNLPRVTTAVMDQQTRKIYLGIGYTYSGDSYTGAIMEIDADSGDRRIVAGLWPDEWGGTVHGSGIAPYLPEVQNLAFGPDGKLYAWARNIENNAQIIRVDRDSGAMQLVWTEHLVLAPERNNPAHAQCSNGDNQGRTFVQINERGFAIDADGNFLLSVIANGAAGYISPVGIVRVAADGSTCEWVRRSGAGEYNAFYNQEIGSGAAPQPGIAFRSLAWIGENLWAIDNFNKVYEIQPANGWRTRAVAAGFGDDWIIPDPTRGVIWFGGSGGGSNNVMAYHPEEQWTAEISCISPEREGYGCLNGPAETCCLNHNPILLDETTGHLILQHDIHGTVRVEVETGNALTFSL